MSTGLGSTAAQCCLSAALVFTRLPARRRGRRQTSGSAPSGEFDAVIDFDKVVRDPANPLQLLPAYNSGDSVHPNDAGYQAMANSIDLRLFSLPNTGWHASQ